MRIAIRDCRAVLRLFERHLEPAVTGRFKSELRHIGEIFGAARDLDVFCLETLQSAIADLPDQRLEDLKLVAEAERRLAHAAVADAVRGNDFAAMILGLAIWAEAGLTQPSTLGDDWMSKRLGAVAPLLLDRAAKAVKQRTCHAGRLSVARRHRLRKSLKKLRFDVESFAGLYRPRATKSYESRCKVLEKILGAANDAAVTQRLALTPVTPVRPDLAKPAAALTRWSKRRGRKTLRGLKDALKEFRAAPTFWR